MPAKKRFLLRIDPTLYDALERWAGDELRSVNAQIEFLLNDALRKAGRKKSAQLKEKTGVQASEDDDEK